MQPAFHDETAAKTVRSAGLRASRGYLDGRTRAARRVKELLASFLPQGRPDPATIAQARRAAELFAAAESLRQRVLGGDAGVDLETLVKIENESRRALRGLGIQSAPHAPGTVSITITEEEARY
jgi:hypothetical protein